MRLVALLSIRQYHRAEPARLAVRLDDEARMRLRQLRSACIDHLGMLELAPVLECYGIRCAPVREAATPAQAAAAAESLGFPVALKVRSREISHKSDGGGVRLGLDSADAVENAAARMLEHVHMARPEAAIEGLLIQRMAAPGKELLLGIVRDQQFGPMVMVGFGGIYVEVLRDTSMRIAPLTPSDALEMLGELKMAPLLHGMRGEPPVDLAALSEAICRFAQLGADLAELAEAEINPLVSCPDGVIAVDARAAL
jgi:acetate---CoA ligase (ADP-forming)